MNSGGAFRIPGMSRLRGPRTSSAPQGTGKASAKPTITQIILLIVFSGILGVLLFYLHNHQSITTTIKNSIMVVSIMIAAIGIASFLNLNINVYDFLIYSQINILCIFLLLCYIGVTSMFSAGTLVSIGEYFSNLLSLTWDPTNLFKKGFSIIMPTLFLLIPIIVLVMNISKNIITGLLVLVVSSAVVFFLWPDNLTASPIGGGKEQSTASKVADTISSVVKVF
jgi:hypothetical protein